MDPAPSSTPSSMLYRTTSASTSASSSSPSSNSHPSHIRRDDRHQAGGSQHDDDDDGCEGAHGNSSDVAARTPCTKKSRVRKRRGKKKKKGNAANGDVAVQAATVVLAKAPSVLAGFVPPTSLTKDRSSQPTTPTLDSKATATSNTSDASSFPLSRNANGKSGEKDMSEASDEAGDGDQDRTLTSAPTDIVHDGGSNKSNGSYLQVRPVDGTNGTHFSDLPSPAESEISSTDELSYVASPKTSPTQTTPHQAQSNTFQPQPKPQAQTVSAPSPSYMSRKDRDDSPFKAAVTGFDFLAAQSAALHKLMAARANLPSVTLSSPPALPLTSPSPSTLTSTSAITTGLGFAGVSTEDRQMQSHMAEESHVEAASPNAQTSTSSKSDSRSTYKALSSPNLPDDIALKKVAASPLTWSNNHRVMDAPTLGSPTLDNIKDQDGSALSYAITRASFAVSKDTILQELARKKEESKRLQSNGEENAGLDFSSPLPAFPQWHGNSDEDPYNAKDEHQRSYRGNQAASVTNETGVTRRDMAMPNGSTSYTGPPHSAWQVHSPTLPINDQAISAMLDTASLQGMTPASDSLHRPGSGWADGGATSAAAADIEDTLDDARSEVSDTSLLVKNATRDSDDRGWEALDENVSKSPWKARRRLSGAIHLLNRRHRPSKAVIEARREIIQKIRKKLNAMLPEWSPDFQYHIKTFGSTAYGLDTDNSDLDLCIIDPKRPDGFRNAADLYDIAEESASADTAAAFANTNGDTVGESEGPAAGMSTTEDDEDAAVLTPFQRRKREKRQPWTSQKQNKLDLDPIYDVRRLGDMLKRMRFGGVTPIPNAVVPIVKFTSRDGIKADMNANEQLGVRNSALLAEYISSSPIIRPFLIFLKVWAKKRGINDPSGQNGPMSLSSYSLVLMAIGYLQHIGLVQNIQDLALIEQRGVERQVFWTKIANKDAIKPHRYGRGKLRGDYRALAVDTTFVSSIQRSTVAHPSGQPNGQQSGKATKRKTHIGWESASQSETESSGSPRGANLVNGQSGPRDVLELVEGFFDYYTGFPIESRAVSIWSGKPIDRITGYMSPAGDSEGLLPQLPKISREEREELYEDGKEEEDEELFHGVQDLTVDTVHGPSESDLTDADDKTDSDTVTEDEAIKKFDAEIAERLKAFGLSESGPSFEAALKAQRVKSPKMSAEVLQAPAANGHAIERSPRKPQQSNSSHNGLDVKQACRDTNLFPMPPVERPEDFVEPPTWTQRLVVQDPFIHTRNTCMNIIPDMVDRIWKEMHRALEMVRAGKPLDKICLSAKRDPSVSPMMKPHWKAHKAAAEARRSAKVAHRQAKRDKNMRKTRRKEESTAKNAAKREQRISPQQTGHPSTSTRPES